MRIDNYEVGGFYDEMFASESGPRACARRLLDTLETLPAGEVLNRQRAAERLLLQMGITFNVYGEQAGVEKIFPVRHPSAHRLRRRMDPHRKGTQATHSGAEPFH